MQFGVDVHCLLKIRSFAESFNFKSSMRKAESSFSFNFKSSMKKAEWPDFHCPVSLGNVPPWLFYSA